MSGPGVDLRKPSLDGPFGGLSPGARSKLQKHCTIVTVCCGMLALASCVAFALTWRARHQPALGSEAFGAMVGCGVAAALCAALLATRPWEFATRRVWLTSVAFTLVCAVGITICWAAIVRDGGQRMAAGQIVRDSRGVQNYLNGAMPSGRNPVVIPTGLYVESIEFTNSNNVIVSGYVWQRYPADTPRGITRGIVFPEADNSYPEKIAYEKTASDGSKITGWYFNATFRQNFDYRAYPLDRQNVWLRMWQPDFDKDAVLVPDFASYPPWLEKRMLGVDPQIVTGEWQPMYTSYSYAHYVYPSSFGLSKYDRPVSYPDLYFNMVYKRNFVGAVIGNLIPVILISLVVFASLFVTSRDQKLELFGSNTFAVMAFLVTMLLVVVVDHNEIRSISADGSVMYLEYMYFAIYLLLLLATANGVLIALDRPAEILNKNGNLLAKALYWPLLALVTLAGTIVVFFGVGW